jgi:AraC family transcriptional regulator
MHALMREDALVDISAIAALPVSNDPLAVLAHIPGSTACLPVSVLPIPGKGELINEDHPNARIYVAESGSGRRWYRRGNRTAQLQTAPLMVEMCEKGLSFDECRWEGEAGRCVLIDLLDSDVESHTHGELSALNFPTRHEVFDEKVSTIALELANQALRGLPDGRMFSQGLSMTLLGWLGQHYNGGRRPSEPRHFGVFGSSQRARIFDLIRSDLGQDLSLQRLAGEVGLSPYHFSRVFKATFGISPHRFVQMQRLDTAAKALRGDRRKSIAEIAIEHGFSSQSHMTELMRRRLGVTPRRMRTGSS